MKNFNLQEKSELTQAYVNAQKNHYASFGWIYHELKKINPNTAKKFLDNEMEDRRNDIFNPD